MAALFFGTLLAVANPITPRGLLLDGALAGTDVVAVGERGTIVRSADNARTWEAVPLVTRATLTGIAFAADGRHGWAVGHDALILGTSDSGQTWIRQWQGPNLSDSFLDVVALSNTHVVAVGAYGLFVQSSDGGKSWARRKIIEDDYHLNRVARGPSGTLYIAGEHGTLLRSKDGGQNWTQIASPYDGSFYGILPLDQRTLIAHGLRGRIFRSADDGETWSPVAAPQPMLLATAIKLKSNFIAIAGQARALLVSRDYGRSVSPWAVPFTAAVAELLELPDGSVLALGESGATLLPKP